MTQAKILVDTNAYLRLAKTISPLLSTPIGGSNFYLYILPELNKELGARKLQSKFPWVDEDEYAENRKAFPVVSRKQKNSIKNHFEYVWDHVTTELPGPSKVDALYIAYSIELGFPIVTDDQDMTKLANEFGVDVISTMQLLKLMLDHSHIDIKKIESLINFWKYNSDLPSNFSKDLKLFNLK